MFRKLQTEWLKRAELSEKLVMFLENDFECAQDRVFWIRGKPGSGKSCLTKYLAGHDQTDELLTR
jgi:ABC-type polysaccharide/polyol phosphate transport system ATPase subunit